MKKTFCITFLFVVFLTQISFAQSINLKIREYPIFSGNNSLVLDSYDTLTIAYFEDTTTHIGYFLGETLAHPNGRYIAMLPEMKVNDIDFYRENLLFGGSYVKSGVKHGLLGRMFAPNSFDWGQNMEYIMLDWINVGGVSVLITDVKRVVNIIDQSTCLPYFRFACVGTCKASYMGDTV